MVVSLRHIIGILVMVALLLGGAFQMGSRLAKNDSETASATAPLSATTTIEAPENAPLYSVVRIVDGDTVVISKDGKDVTIRMIGIDTPEINDSRTGVQCFGKEAAAETKSMLISQKVSLEIDPSQGEYDKYKRLLAYVFRSDGLFVNEELIAQGFAHEYTYDQPYKYQAEFKSAEKEARENERGLWASDACPTPPPKRSSKFEKTNVVQTASAAVPVPPPQTQAQVQQSNQALVTPQIAATEPQAPPSQLPPQPVQQSQPAPAQPQPSPAAQSIDTSKYICSSNTYNCSDFKTQAEAQAVYDKCGGLANDVHKLDKNKDGHACDSLP